MRVSNNKEKYLKYYFESIHFMGNLQTSELNTMSEMNGQGAEYISCSFDPNDEDYIDGFVTLFFWKPADNEDTKVVVENNLFYEYLLNVCKNHLSKIPNDKEKIQNCLEKIKVHLKL
ncbi:MAG: ribonuclease toxin immunity protein CdiI [Clostridiales bacterium]